MRFFSRPVSGIANGSTLSASVRLPVGASTSSQASPSTINPSRLPTATARLHATTGGIGVVLFEVIRGFQYAQTCAVLILLAVSVTLIDLLSATVRKRFI